MDFFNPTHKHQMSSATTPTGRSQIPIDIMLDILDNLDKSDIATMCRLNKLCCAFSQPVLFRDIRIQFSDTADIDRGHSVKHDRGFALCETLSRSPHLARCVRSFSVRIYETSMRFAAKIVETLEFLPSLRHLGLYVYFNFTRLLEGRTFSFKLESFTFNLSYDTNPRYPDFLNSQTSLTAVKILLNSQTSLTTVDIRFHEHSDFPYSPRWEFERKCLPNLTRITTNLIDAEEFIRGRPVSEITCIGEPDIKRNITLDFFSLSTAPIRKLTINYDCLYKGAKPGQLRELFPSLAYLKLTSHFRFEAIISVRVSLRLFIRLIKYVIERPRNL